MAGEESRGSSHFHDIRAVKALLLDPSKVSGGRIKDRMIDVGLRDIATCSKVAELPALLEEHSPDLLLLDIDNEREAVCQAIQTLRSQDRKAGNPFAVIIGVTGQDQRDAVVAALEAGIDGMLAKPVSTSGLRDCLREQIDERKDFIATEDYVGPDRRPEDREPSDEELVSVEVPNSLRSKAAGEKLDPEEAQRRLDQTLRSLTIQRVWHLSRKISSIAENARKAMESGKDFPLLGECVEAMDTALNRICDLDSEYELPAMSEVIASARSALATISLAGEDLTARHFELLRVHADSVEVSMKESEEARDVLVTELERAVQAVRARDTFGRPARKGDAEEADPAAGAGYPFKVRFLAWWEGVDPSEVAATRQGST